MCVGMYIFKIFLLFTKLVCCMLSSTQLDLHYGAAWQIYDMVSNICNWYWILTWL